MTQPETNVGDREKELTERLKNMELQMERLAARLGEGESSGAAGFGAGETAPKSEKVAPMEDIADVSDEVLSWANRNALLPRLATLCFLLVVALILRTITDSGVIDKLIGSGIGMAYAAILIIAGWHKYGKNSPLAPIMAASGAILMSTIVVETHTHFNSLPLVPAYLTLMTTGIVMALISRQFNAFTPISVGILSMSFAGAAIDYPHPSFLYLSLVLFTANLLGYFAAQLKRCSWLRWSALLVTMFIFQLWGVQVVTALRKGGTIPPELAISWFLPVIAVFSAFYLLLALLGVFRKDRDGISIFDLALPTINVLWTFSLMLYVAKAMGGNNAVMIGGVGVFAAFCHLALSFWLAKLRGEGAPGAAAFSVACGVLLAIALPVATGHWTLSLPIISLVAILMAVMSRGWRSGTVRVTTYLFQLYCCVSLAAAFKGGGPASMDAVNILPSALVTGIILYHYQWCRWWPPTEEYSFFSRFDTHDRSAVILLLAGLISGFFMMRIVLFHGVALLPAVMHRDAFVCAQSIMINSAAIALILIAFLKKNKEIRNVAIFVMVVGGIKVFMSDLMGIHGLPLVLSVFSFGMAAAAESFALSSWQKQKFDLT